MMNPFSNSSISVDGLGFCIYCKIRTKLTNEHVEPYSMGGRLIIRNASCLKCCQVTSMIERKFSKDYLGKFRSAVGYPSRRFKSHPNIIKAWIGTEDNKIEIDVDRRNYPQTICLPFISEPNMLVGRSATHPLNFKLWSVTLNQNKAAAVGVSFNFKVDDVIKYIAKVCHSAAYAFLGNHCDMFTQYLPEIIAGKRKDAMYFIGGDWDGVDNKEYMLPLYTTIQTKYSFDKLYDNGREILIVKFQMFSDIGGPVYKSVFGSRKIGFLPMTPLPVRSEFLSNA